MKTMRIVISSLALTSFLLATNCTMDGEEPVDELSAENENQAGATPPEESNDSELPSPDPSMAEGVGETVDSNTDAIVQELPEDQQQDLSQAQVIPQTEEPTQFELNQNAGTPVADTTGAETGVADTNSDGVVTAEDPTVGAEDSAVPSLADVADDSSMAAPEAESSSPAKRSKRSRSTQPESEATLDPNFKYYVVQPGDTLGEISQVVYGTSRRWQELAQLNGLGETQAIFPGDMLKYNPDSTSSDFDQQFSALERSTVVVQPRETLSQIATKVMGEASFWKLLWRWNEATVPDPHKIQPGQTLNYVAPQTLTGFFSQRKSQVPAH